MSYFDRTDSKPPEAAAPSCDPLSPLSTSSRVGPSDFIGANPIADLGKASSTNVSPWTPSYVIPLKRSSPNPPPHYSIPPPGSGVPADPQALHIRDVIANLLQNPAQSDAVIKILTDLVGALGLGSSPSVTSPGVSNAEVDLLPLVARLHPDAPLSSPLTQADVKHLVGVLEGTRCPVCRTKFLTGNSLMGHLRGRKDDKHQMWRRGEEQALAEDR
ncbi:hypothetical protein BDK51DRAFT_39938 [Blyttiomyces helicus]|uniref:Uncharacterized protein n=1 Tax=Blyttiomyces helicus TaxID=388810 RepID=A0A4P9VWT1_9FUNG|nr:hypothetical protein BDK51DRAFT_39938 [Blyttiomyces helicus]|eukprot:RKO83652.1 hypothetical protein BDK51DRAFT_39938 [Blyttiomyces helicus]